MQVRLPLLLLWLLDLAPEEWQASLIICLVEEGRLVQKVEVSLI